MLETLVKSRASAYPPACIPLSLFRQTQSYRKFAYLRYDEEKKKDANNKPPFFLLPVYSLLNNKQRVPSFSSIFYLLFFTPFFLERVLRVWTVFIEKG